MASALHFRVAARTDVGKKRSQNEDAFGLFPELDLYVVADGIGGHVGGRVASAMAVEEIQRSLAQKRQDDLTPVLDQHGHSSVGGRCLVLALQDANDKIRDASEGDPSLRGMGAVVAALAFDAKNGLAAVCHVGDARVYRVRGDDIAQLTEDHTVVQRLLKSGRIAPEDIESTPNRHMITRALGVEPLVQPDLLLEPAEPGDLFVLSSDGLHDVVTPDEICRVVGALRGNLEAACTQLIELANERGGKDNSTVLIVDCQPGTGAPH